MNDGPKNGVQSVIRPLRSAGDFILSRKSLMDVSLVSVKGNNEWKVVKVEVLNAS